ncbi:hypothetical protein OG196_39645 [Kitasatospora purpeofusca]|uniref:hypothetical protein n=1 Tax=Kitasatospora purpeofusca TaxID=67352 RepID=UPI002E0EEA0E|nr:hypothetical protein OG196_39645 [Kitasatospora purpeofusca]
MSGRGRRAALPPTGYRRAPVIDADGLVVRPVSGAGAELGVWDFRDCPGPEDFRRPLVAALVEQGRDWDSADTWRSQARMLRMFFREAAAADPPIASAGQVTTDWWKAWVGDAHNRRVLAAVLRRVPDLPEVTRVFMEKPQRQSAARRVRGSKQAHTRAELTTVRAAAAATVRAGRLRIAANTALLERWRTGRIDRGDPDRVLGELLDVLARTGDLPREQGKGQQVARLVERAFGYQGTPAALTRTACPGRQPPPPGPRGPEGVPDLQP